VPAFPGRRLRCPFPKPAALGLPPPSPPPWTLHSPPSDSILPPPHTHTTTTTMHPATHPPRTPTAAATTMRPHPFHAPDSPSSHQPPPKVWVMHMFRGVWRKQELGHGPAAPPPPGARPILGFS
jgi:hypothetical protein